MAMIWLSAPRLCPTTTTTGPIPATGWCCVGIGLGTWCGGGFGTQVCQLIALSELSLASFLPIPVPVLTLAFAIVVALFLCKATLFGFLFSTFLEDIITRADLDDGQVLGNVIIAWGITIGDRCGG